MKSTAQAGHEYRDRLEALSYFAFEHGMTPAGGIGIDRLCMMLLG